MALILMWNEGIVFIEAAVFLNLTFYKSKEMFQVKKIKHEMM